MLGPPGMTSTQPGNRAGMSSQMPQGGASQQSQQQKSKSQKKKVCLSEIFYIVIYHQVCNKTNMKCATSGAGFVYPSEFT